MPGGPQGPAKDGYVRPYHQTPTPSRSRHYKKHAPFWSQKSVTFMKWLHSFSTHMTSLWCPSAWCSILRTSPVHRLLFFYTPPVHEILKREDPVSLTYPLLPIYECTPWGPWAALLVKITYRVPCLLFLLLSSPSRGPFWPLAILSHCLDSCPWMVCGRLPRSTSSWNEA